MSQAAPGLAAPAAPQQQSPQIQIQLHGPHEHLLDVIRKLYLGVHYICGGGVEGDVAEFGTMTGLTATVLAQGLGDLDHYRDAKRSIHLFDSFEGFPTIDSPVDQASPQVRSGGWKPGGCRGVSKVQLMNLCCQKLPAGRIRIYDGWFKDTMEQLAPDTKLALLHVDCDLYSSTMDVLEYVFAHGMVSEGAAVLFDDYNCNRASPACGERKAWSECIEKFHIECSDGGEYGWAGRKFYVHGYRPGS